MSTTFKAVHFEKDTNVTFNKTLNERVAAYFEKKNISKHANAQMVFKTIAMLTIYLAPFVALFFITNIWLSYTMWFIMGVGMAGIGLSVMHDANHGAYSRNQKVNVFVGSVINLLGGNATNWQIQHNVLHHTYTNIEGMDEDVDPPVPILRFSPHTEWRKIHKYQFLYAWFFYGLMTIMWFISKDYQQAIRYHKKGLSAAKGVTLGQHLFKIIIGKIIFSILFIVLPAFFFNVPWYINVSGLVLMQFVSGFILACVFQPAHVVPTSTYEKPSDSGHINADWKVHQLFNTANFATNSHLFSWYVGGLNFQVEHHLFPNICHVHYKALSKIVEDTTKEFNLPYFNNQTFFSALAEHTRMLRLLGQKDCPMNVSL